MTTPILRATLTPLFLAVLMAGCSDKPAPVVTDADGPESRPGVTPAPTGDPLPEHLARIPTNGAIVMHVRFAEVWNHPAVKAFRAEVAEGEGGVEEQFRATFGVNPADVETLTAYWPRLSRRGDAREYGVVITTNKAVDQDAVRRAFTGAAPGGGPGPGNPPSLPVGHVPVFDGDRVVRLTTGPLGALYGETQPNELGPLRPALDLAAKGERLLVLGLNRAALSATEFTGGFPPALEAILNADTAFATLDLEGRTMALRARFDAKTPGEAAEIEKAVQGLIGMASSILSDAETNLAGDDEEFRRGAGSAITTMRDALGNAELVGQDGSTTLEVNAELPEGFGSTLAAGLGRVRQAEARTRGSNNLRIVGLAFHNYHDRMGKLPAAAITDKDGKPLLSWRVAILPYLYPGGENLYRQFKLDEPWDSEHNKKLIPMMPGGLSIEGTSPGEGKTFYRVFSGNPAAEAGQTLDTMFPPGKDGMTLTSIASGDGTSNTVMVAESAEAVVWTKPEPMMCEPGKPLPKLGSGASGEAMVLFADGSVRFLKVPIAEETLRAMITPFGGEAISLDQ